MAIRVVEACGNKASGGTPFDGTTCRLEQGHAGWHESGGCSWGVGEYPVPAGHEVLTGEAMEAALAPGTPDGEE